MYILGGLMKAMDGWQTDMIKKVVDDIHAS